MRSADRRIGLKRLWPVMLIIALTVPGQLHAGQEITQTLDLKAGWNAVSLEIGPAEPDPDIIFAGTPVTPITRKIPLSSSFRIAIIFRCGPKNYEIPALGSDWQIRSIITAGFGNPAGTSFTLGSDWQIRTVMAAGFGNPAGATVPNFRETDNAIRTQCGACRPCGNPESSLPGFGL